MKQNTRADRRFSCSDNPVKWSAKGERWLNQSAFPKAEIWGAARCGDAGDDVVAKIDLEELCGFGDSDGEAPVGIARRRVAAWVVVDEDEAVGFVLDDGVEDFAGMRDALGEGAEGDLR